MGRTTSLLVLAVAALGLGAERSAGPDESDQLRQLFADDWEFQLREDPLFATATGDHRYNDRLPSVTVADHERRRTQERAFLERLRAIDRERLSPEEQVNYDIFERLKEDALAEHGFPSHLVPITNRSGFHVEFPELPDRVPLQTVRDYENYIARLNGFLAYAHQHMELMRAGVREGWVLPAVVLQGYETALSAHIMDDATKSLLFEPFRNFPAAIETSERARLVEAGMRAIEQSVAPGYREFLAFMRREYVPAARKEIGISALPNGRAFYEHRVRRFTTLDVTPREVHELGLREVARIRGEMQVILSQLGFGGDIRAFADHLRKEDRFYVETPEALLKEVAYVLKRMDGELPRLFGTLPRMSYGIKPVPAYIAPKTTTAYYEQPAGDGTRAGFYYVNTYDLRSRPLYEIEALSLHEPASSSPTPTPSTRGRSGRWKR